MKKIGIITLSGNYNYGNRLQNYAMQEAYKKVGLEVESIWNSIGEQPDYKSPFKQRIKNKIKPLFGKVNYDAVREERNKNFRDFTNNYINNSTYRITDDKHNEELNKMYDLFSVGSDQVWNYTFGNMTDIEFLRFADREKTIAYAPSFGISEIPKDKEHLYIDGLKHIKHLSVREDAGAKIIKELVNRDASVVLDPTMLLDVEDYKKIENKPSKLKDKKYILLYFLGNISDKRREEIKKVSEKFDLNIVNITDIYDPCHNAGPREFLYLFHNAEMILTDSFHACVFSLLYQNPFYVYNREENISNMNSRLDTFLGTFDLLDRKIDNLKCNKKIFEIDYDKSNKKLKKLRKECYNYIEEAINENK